MGGVVPRGALQEDHGAVPDERVRGPEDEGDDEERRGRIDVEDPPAVDVVDDEAHDEHHRR